MFLRLFLLFTLVPFVELVILLKLSEMHGWVTTICLIIVTGIVGTILARQQGFEVWNRIHSELNAGKPPTDSLMDGLMILVASALLITPGVLTDIVGFLLLFPPFRSVLRGRMKAYFTRSGSFKVFTQSTGQSAGQQTSFDQAQTNRPTHDASGREIIDVEFTKKTSE